MSVSDPLVKDVKEKIFHQGLIRQQNTKYFNRTIDPFAWLISISRDNTSYDYTYDHCVDRVKENHASGVYKSDGRFRMLIKWCLFKKCLHVPLELLKSSGIAHILYTSNSILGDEILTEILLSVLRQVSQLQFNLDVTNTSFLDTSWYIPDIVDIELVPCRALGIAISFAKDKAVIVNIEPDGVASENNNIVIGDVLDRLNGVHINSHYKGRLSNILKSNKNKPVTIRILKAYNKTINQIYEPIRQLLKELKIDWNNIKRYYEGEKDDNHNDKRISCFGYYVKYLAKIDVGEMGNLKQVKKAIKSLIDNHFQDFKIIEKIDKDVLLETGELEIRIRDKDTDEIIMQHSYMKISSCGNLAIFPKIFGYCASEKNCDVAENFHCYIFETLNFSDTDLMLHSIGQGFHRTHYAV